MKTVILFVACHRMFAYHYTIISMPQHENAFVCQTVRRTEGVNRKKSIKWSVCFGFRKLDVESSALLLSSGHQPCSILLAAISISISQWLVSLPDTNDRVNETTTNDAMKCKLKWCEWTLNGIIYCINENRFLNSKRKTPAKKKATEKRKENQKPILMKINIPTKLNCGTQFPSHSFAEWGCLCETDLYTVKYVKCVYIVDDFQVCYARVVLWEVYSVLFPRLSLTAIKNSWKINIKLGKINFMCNLVAN